jgi:hypothetical protein
VVAPSSTVIMENGPHLSPAHTPVPGGNIWYDTVSTSTVWRKSLDKSHLYCEPAKVALCAESGIDLVVAYPFPSTMGICLFPLAPKPNKTM